jgi:hypothetical protein
VKRIITTPSSNTDPTSATVSFVRGKNDVTTNASTMAVSSIRMPSATLRITTNSDAATTRAGSPKRRVRSW